MLRKDKWILIKKATRKKKYIILTISGSATAGVLNK